METVGDGPRVKFALRFAGSLDPGLLAGQQALADAMTRLDQAGCCPVLDDGLAAGNGALRTANGTLLVSPSGRRPGPCDPDSIVELVAFDPIGWTAAYRSRNEELRPTSDAPLHWAALVEAPVAFGWDEAPFASLHGHVLETNRAAVLLELPISDEATLFSTPPDREALLALLARAPYPHHCTVIRRDHGFFTLGPDLDETIERVEVLAARARTAGLLPG